MAVTVRETLDDATVSSATIDLVTGAGTAVGDVLLLFHATTFYGASAMLTPSGGGTWQGPIAIARNDGTNSTHIKAWWREVTSGGAQTVTTNHSNSNGPQHAHVFVLAGADTTDPVSDSAVLDNAFGTSQVAPSADGVEDGLLACAWVSDDITTYTAPGGMTGNESDTGSFSVALTAYEALSATEATGTRTATTAAARTHSAMSITIAPASGGSTVEGTATGEFGFTAPAAGKRTVKGTATGQFGTSTAAVGKRTVKATATGGSGFTAPAAGTRTVRGAAVGSFGFTGNATGHRTVTGNATGAFGITATAFGTRTVHGAGTGLFGFTAPASGEGAAQGSATAESGFAAPATGHRTVRATATAAVGFTAAAAGRRTVHATATAGFGFTAPIVVVSDIILRPNTGIIVRPFTGIIARP